MSLTYQIDSSNGQPIVSIGKTYPQKAFELENRWDLEVVDLDKKLAEANAQKPVSGVNAARSSQ